MVTSDFRREVEIWPFRACAKHPAIITGTDRSLWTWLWGRYHVPQNVFLILIIKLCGYTIISTKHQIAAVLPIYCTQDLVHELPKLQYFGHVMRAGVGQLVLTVLEGNVEDRQLREA